jgi:membrane protease YdiL (CAAX protease family)
MEPTAPARSTSGSDGTTTYFALACGITWALAAPAALAWMRHQSPPPPAIGAAGLSAFGPLLAALAVAGPRRQLRQVFGRWRTNPLWILGGLLLVPAVHLVATALYAAIGGRPAQWFHPPTTPATMAALVVFPLGEEFGWRGFAHPRMVRRHGPVRGCLILGAVWGLWHLAYSITPQTGAFDVFLFGLTMAELPFYALIIGWVFERANGSMAVAIALHLGAHIDHIEWAPRTDLRLHALHLLVLGAIAALAARSLARRGATTAGGATTAD